VAFADQLLLYQLELIDGVLDALFVLENNDDDSLVLLQMAVLGVLPVLLGHFELLSVEFDAVDLSPVALGGLAYPDHLWLTRDVRVFNHIV